MLELFRPTTSKAYTIANDLPYNRNIADTQWNPDSNQVISYSFGLLGRDDSESVQIFKMQLNGRYVGHLNEDLAYTVIVKDSNYVQLYHAADTILGETIEVSLPPVTADSTEIAYRIQILVFRTDGSNIYRSDMYRANFTAWLSVVENVPDNTLPADWLGTGTSAFSNPMETATTIVPPNYLVDEDVIDDSLDIPERILSSMGFVVGIITQILSLRYVTFMLCFALVVGLLGWLLH